MYFDEHNMVALEQCAWPGNVGDSVHDTNRYRGMNMFVNGANTLMIENYVSCTTNLGYLRHPSLKGFVDPKGNSWAEDDFSGDAWLAMQLGLRIGGFNGFANEMVQRLRDNWWRYGNGDFIHPGHISVIKRGEMRQNWFTDLPLHGQSILLHKFKWRWNDQYNCFRETEESSADWLNQLLALIHAERYGHTASSRKAKDILNLKVMMEKWEHYWRNEPDNSLMLDLAWLAGKKLWA